MSMVLQFLLITKSQTLNADSGAEAAVRTKPALALVCAMFLTLKAGPAQEAGCIFLINVSFAVQL